MKIGKYLLGLLCCVLLAGCGSGAQESTSTASAAAEATPADKAAEAGFEEQEFYGIHFMADPSWKVEIGENDEVCRLYTENENIFFVLGHVTKDAIVNNTTDEGIYGSLEVFLGKEDQDEQRLKFENGTLYLSYFSDFETDHAYNSIFYTKEGLFAFGLQLVGEIDEAEEAEYEQDYRLMLDTMQFEVPEYQSMK